MAVADRAGVVTPPVPITKRRDRSSNPWFRAGRRFGRNPLAVSGLGILVMFVLVSAAAPLIATHDPVRGVLAESREGPSADHWFGTDQIGRDIFSRVVYGGRVSLGISVVAVVISVTLGAVIGAYTAYRGGWVDTAVQRVCEVVMAFPGLLLALAIVASVGASMQSLIIAITVGAVPRYIRVVRSVVLSIRSYPYVEAANSLGATTPRVVIRHVLPNAATPLIIQGTLQLAGVLLIVSGLSFLGLGIAPPTPEWGGMISDGRAYIRTASHMIWFPGFTLALAVLGFNLLGDGLRDALDVADNN